MTVGSFHPGGAFNRDHGICCRLVDELINYNNRNHTVSFSTVAFL